MKQKSSYVLKKKKKKKKKNKKKKKKYVLKQIKWTNLIKKWALPFDSIP